jgi:tetratricopeptide (TPR) repeat protein
MTLNPLFQKGEILFAQRRYDLAEHEYRKAIAFDPSHPISKSMLALCLCEQKKYREAIQMAREAVAEGPDESYCHYARAHVFFRCSRLNQARPAIIEAIRLNPNHAANFGEHALIELNAGNPSKALTVAAQGLALNPEDLNSHIARVRALDRLGRKKQAREAAKELLRIGPDDQYAHLNTGWSFLTLGDHRQAAEHFREALRINPSLEDAQKGLLEALRRRFFLYRILPSLGLGQPLTFGTFFLWVTLFPLLATLLVFTILFRPFWAALLRLDRRGRLSMTPDQIAESNLSCSATLLGTFSTVAMFLTAHAEFLLPAVTFFAAPVLIKIAFECRAGWARWAVFSLTAGLPIYAVGAAIWLSRVDPGGRTHSHRWGEQFTDLVFYGFIAFILLISVSAAISTASRRV